MGIYLEAQLYDEWGYYVMSQKSHDMSFAQYPVFQEIS